MKQKIKEKSKEKLLLKNSSLQKKGNFLKMKTNPMGVWDGFRDLVFSSEEYERFRK